MEKLIIIKLGGSVITDKNKPYPKARLRTIKRLAEEIARILRQNQFKLILVHGAGSYAHPLVKKHNLHLRVVSNEQKEALGIAHKQLMELHSLVINSLTKNRVLSVSFPPHAFVKQKNGKILNFDYSLIKKAIEENFVPVLFGDMVLDERIGFSVLSGDTIVAYLANRLKAYKVIFLSDIDGIYTSDPRKNPTAKLIPEINNKNFNEVVKGLSATGRQDVTGEIKGKIISLRQNLKGIPVVVANGLKSQILQQALMQASTGTKLLLN